nr:30S ribosomal protein S1 [Parachlamydiaceae bacterium]
MPRNPQHSWTESNIIDDVSFQEQDAQDFKKLLGLKESVVTPETPQHTPGTILVGRIVEIT